MHASHQISEVYVAKLKGIPTKSTLKLLKKGITSKGEKLSADNVKIISANKQKNTSIVEITLHEGKNRQVRRMFEEIDFPVQKLSREKYSFLDLKGLQSGEDRKLTKEEVHLLKEEALNNKLR